MVLKSRPEPSALLVVSSQPVNGAELAATPTVRRVVFDPAGTRQGWAAEEFAIVLLKVEATTAEAAEPGRVRGTTQDVTIVAL